MSYTSPLTKKCYTSMEACKQQACTRMTMAAILTLGALAVWTVLQGPAEEKQSFERAEGRHRHLLDSKLWSLHLLVLSSQHLSLAKCSEATIIPNAICAL